MQGQPTAQTKMVAENDGGASHSLPVKRTAEDLAEVMRRRREQCTVLESVPGESTADTGTSRKETESDQRPSVFESNPNGSSADFAASTSSSAGRTVVPRPSAKLCAGDSDISRWMEKIRDRCQVYESLPEQGAADFQWSATTPAVEKVEYSAPRAVARLPPPHVRSVPRQGGSSSSTTTVPAEPKLPNHGATGNADCSARGPTGENGTATGVSERRSVWQEHLQLSSGEKASVPILRKLLSLAHQEDGAGKPSWEELADGFAAKHFPVAAGEDASSSSSVKPLCTLLAQLLRYHYPKAATSVEQAATSEGTSLRETLISACGGSGSALAERVFALDAEAQVAGLRLVCDTVVVDGRETLLIFVLLALLAAADVGSAASCKEAARKWNEALGALRSSTTEQATEVLHLAQDLHEATPMSLTACWPSDDAIFHEASSMCVVAPDEVLRHIYEQPVSSWRFVVADVRTTANIEVALPVSMRIDSSEDRAALLAEMPYEECIHLCLVADGPPTSKEDEAYRLCEALSQGPTWRKHISVVDGGWPAVHNLVQSMGLDLMDVELEGAAAAITEAAALEAAEAGEVAEAGEPANVAAGDAAGDAASNENALRTAATLVGKGFARRGKKLLRGASRAWQKLSEDFTETMEGFSGKKGFRREIEFGPGTLGFDVQGTVVKLVDSEGQAAAHGVQVGDRLIAVEGKEIPEPPTTDSADVAEQRLKRLIKKWIKEHPRPVRLIFERVPVSPSGQVAVAAPPAAE